MKKEVGFYFMILGLVIGIFSMSFFISYDKSMNQNIFSKINTENYLTYKLLSQTKLKEIKEKLDNENVGVILENPVENLNFNILGMNQEGLRLYNIKTKNNAVVIGKSLKRFAYKKDGKEYMKIGEREYEVLAYANEDILAYTVIMSLDDFSKIYSEKEIYNLTINFVEEDISKEVFDEKIKNFNLKGVGGSKCEIDLIEATEEKTVGLYVGVIILAISFINVCTFSLMWITGRTKELALYKAIGAKNRDIFFMLFKEIFEIALISMGIALGLHLVVNGFINSSNVINSYLSVDIYNLLKCSFIILVMSFGSVIPAYIITTSIQPAIVLKED